MKKISLIILFIIAGRGNNNHGADLSHTTVLWKGYPNQNEEYLLRFKEASNCASSFGYNRLGQPFLIVVSSPFPCYSSASAVGCIDFGENTIYIFDNSLLKNAYIPNYPSITALDPLKHESMHWITNQGNNAHDEPYFKKCESTMVSLPTQSGTGIITWATASVI